ncbi:MAG: nucleotidyltransferase family protein [Candidatus Ratteibacteria bacterium]|nr:nucleotidyltransferase family protein [Candidatus Ratteibacteria bacterium]
MMSKEEILRLLEQVREEIMKKYKVKRLGLFGSFIKGEQKKGSDIDILVEFEENADLFDFLGLALFLEEKLNQKVDVVPERALREELKKSILKEAAYL